MMDRDPGISTGNPATSVGDRAPTDEEVSSSNPQIHHVLCSDFGRGVESTHLIQGPVIENRVPAPEFVFRQDGDTYFIMAFGRQGHFPRLKGFQQLQMLLRSPGTGVRMSSLFGGECGNRGIAENHSRQPAADAELLDQLRDQRRTAQADLDRALAENNTVEADLSRNELETIDGQLRSVTGIRGKARDLNNPADKLRGSLFGSIRRVIAKLRQAIPPLCGLADHLEASIRSEGVNFVYDCKGTPPGWDFGE